MEARPDQDRGVIWFLTDARGHKDEEIAAAHEVGLVFIDQESRAYLSISVRAVVIRDNGKASEIWKKTDEAWWPEGSADPNVRVLRVDPAIAELWDGPASAAAAAFEFAKARVTGEKPNLGESRKTTTRMR